MSEIPEMIPVHSSHIKSIGYVLEFEDLYVQFLAGDIYVYRNVPEKVYQDFMGAPSKGSFLHDHIKKENYVYEKI